VTQQRLKWIDAARGIAILFVVLGHNSIPRAVGNYIYSFHIPLFFMISGYLFAMKKYREFPRFLRKKAATLLVPYVVFYAVMFIYFVLIGNRYGETSGMSMWIPVKGFFYSNSDNLQDIFRPMWFLTCLFVVEIMFFWIHRFVRNGFQLALVLIVSSAIGFFSGLYLPFRLPWSMDTAFTAVVFCGVGYLLRENDDRLQVKRPPARIMLILLFLAVNLVFSRLNRGVSLLSNNYHNYFYFYVAAIAGILGYTLIARVIRDFRPLTFIGKNSLIIFAFHAMVIGLIKGFMSKVLNFPMNNFKNSLLWGVALTLACMVVLVPVIHVLNRYFPFILGRKKEKRAAASV
jgi:fucose 4-O-acetylase-like acetyltransferase